MFCQFNTKIHRKLSNICWSKEIFPRSLRYWYTLCNSVQYEEWLTIEFRKLLPRSLLSGWGSCSHLLARWRAPYIESVFVHVLYASSPSKKTITGVISLAWNGERGLSFILLQSDQNVHQFYYILDIELYWLDDFSHFEIFKRYTWIGQCVHSILFCIIIKIIYMCTYLQSGRNTGIGWPWPLTKYMLSHCLWVRQPEERVITVLLHGHCNLDYQLELIICVYLARPWYLSGSDNFSSFEFSAYNSTKSHVF